MMITVNITDEGNLELGSLGLSDHYLLKKWFEDWHKGLVSVTCPCIGAKPASKGNLASTILNEKQ